MYNIYNMPLMHKRLGAGVIKRYDGDKITVRFASGDVTFWFPKAFSCGLSTTNAEDEARIRELADRWNEYANIAAAKEEALREAEEAEELALQTATGPIAVLRRFLRKYRGALSWIPAIAAIVFGAVTLLLPLAWLIPQELAELMFGWNESGYGIFKFAEQFKETYGEALDAGFTVPVILTIVAGGLSLLAGVAGTVLNRFRQSLAMPVLAAALSVAVFAFGVGQAAWFIGEVNAALGEATEMVNASAGEFSVVCIVFGILFALFFGTCAVMYAIADKRHKPVKIELTAEEEAEEIELQTATGPLAALRRFLHKHRRGLSWTSVIGAIVFGAVTLLLPLAWLIPQELAERMFGWNESGYGIFKFAEQFKEMNGESLDAGFTVPVILTIIAGGLSLLAGVFGIFRHKSRKSLVLPALSAALSFAVFAFGVGQAAWFISEVNTALGEAVGMVRASAGEFSVVCIVFGLLFTLFFGICTFMCVIAEKKHISEQQS